MMIFMIKPEGLYNTYDLTLRVTDTNISSLPSGLLKYLADIRFITIDLRRNKLKTLRPEVFLEQSVDDSQTNWKSQQILGLFNTYMYDLFVLSYPFLV